MIRYILHRNLKALRRERGMVLIAVLMFIAVILPVTLLILDSVRIESLLPVNEAYTKTAGDEADKGFDDAIAAIMADQDPFLMDVSRELVVPGPGGEDILNPEYFVDQDPDTISGKHEIDYLAEMWARHPENDTIFLIERSLENIDHPENPDAGADPDVHSVPVRWQLMNVPFGMDDFGEFYDEGDDFPRIMLPFEYVGERVQTPGERDAPAFYLDTSEMSMLSGDHEGDSASRLAFDALEDLWWQLPPSDPNFYEDLARLDPITQFIPRPASYFRNTSGETINSPMTYADAGLPGTELDFSAAFMQENNNAVDRFVYDCLYDYNSTVNQYPYYMPLQQAVMESRWCNPYFGSTGATTLLNPFVTSNKEYKPAPGTITRYQLGAQEEDAVPGWHETIVSDESGRFPINSLLNVIFSSHNMDYEDNLEVPLVRRDQFDDMNDWDDLLANDDHPNHSGFLLARAMLVSLLITDADMARLARSFDAADFLSYEEHATWMIRQMLMRRLQLDVSSDFNRNGDYSDDESAGEIFQFPEMTGNNDSDTLEIPPPGDDILDGSGRMGDGQDLWDGTWRVYTNPKEMLTEFVGYDDAGMPPGSERISARDFELLNQRVTVHSMDTEYTADPDHPQLIPWDPSDDPLGIQNARQNIQNMWPEDNPETVRVDESALYDFLLPIIGRARVMSIIAWREGMVDLNGDGDLNDEYIEQPVSDERYDPDTDSYEPGDDWPVSTITYRERNHPNYQDPHLPAHLVDPDYLNIRSLGDLITIPMSVPEGLIAYSEAPSAAAAPRLRLRNQDGTDPAAGPVVLATRSLYPDFSNAGSEIAYDDWDDVFRNDLTLSNEVLVENNRLHPSWGAGDAMMAYYDGDDIRMHDMFTDADSLVLSNADLPPDIDLTSDAIPFWDLWPGLIGDAIFEMGSPDASPHGGHNEIAFAQVDPGSTGDVFLDPDVAFNIATVKLDGTLLDLLTDNPLGWYDYAPDFSPDGEWIVFTRSTYFFFDFLPPPIRDSVDPIPITTIWLMDRGGSFQIPMQAFWEVGLMGAGTFIEMDPTPPIFTVRMHQPMFPNWSPDGRSIVFMDCMVEFQFDITGGGPPYPITAVLSEADVRWMDVDFFQPWAAMRTRPEFSDPNVYEIFPDWGLGSIRPAFQTDSQFGTLPGQPVTLTNSPSTDSPFDDDERRTIASEIKEASLALRRSIGFGADDQNWRLKDLPVVPEHVVDVLEQLADVICFRDPVVAYDPRYQQPDPLPFPPPDLADVPLQAYPGRVNINTASRPVLRTVFLRMFQGPKHDQEDNGVYNGPMPRVRDGMDSEYLNLLDPNLPDDWRFMAIMIADRYAHQVCEYRRWIYNNLGVLGVTDETVPSNLPLYEAVFPTVSHYGNYRANPFYPMVDTDDDGVAPDVPRYNPEPPFRSVAGLFHVSLPAGSMTLPPGGTTEDWMYEGIDGNGGPDRTHLPRPVDSDGNPTGTYYQHEIWGPIYNADDERTCTHPSGMLGAGGTLYGFETRVDNDESNPDNDFLRHQLFRLFSADDFRRIAPYLTVRTYNYRIESRGVVRVASGAQRTDIRRDKIWIITTNTEANYGMRRNPTWDIAVPFDWSFSAQNRGTGDYYVLYYEETPQSGLELVRRSFLPD